MRWQIGNYIFCVRQQTLSSNGSSVQLEPMAVELLHYFCQHANKIVSIDELIEKVWLGRVVSDNAVSRLVTKLRKAFNDDARHPQYIATFPKKGYKFIAPVSVYEDTQSVLVETTEHSKPNNKLPWILAVAVMIIFGSLLVVSLLPESSPVITQAKALTRNSAIDLFPQVSPDGTRLAYMSDQNNYMYLFIKRLADQKQIEVSHGESLGVGPASWSDDGKWIVYLVANQQECHYYLRSIEDLTLGQATLLHNCPAGSFGFIGFTHNNQQLIYAENNGPGTAYSLFKLDIQSGQKLRLNQPQQVLAGNNQFDLHPGENKLLISSPDEQQWEGFYQLDLDNDELSLLFKQDAYICCGIWSHDGKRVVLMGEHPAYQLVSYDLQGKDAQVIYSGTQQLSRPFRHSNGKDYLFSSGQDNLDIHLFDLEKGSSSILLNASVDDRLARFAHHSDRVAYIGLSSGSEEVWLSDLESNNKTMLSRFNDSRHYIDLLWSNDDSKLVGLTLNEIHLIDLQTGHSKTLKLPQTEIRGVSFKDKQTLSFSRKEAGRWQVYWYDLNTDSVSKADAKWAFIRFQANADNNLWLDSAGQLYSGLEPKLISDSTIKQADLLFGRMFNLTKRGQQWYWFNYDGQFTLNSYDDSAKQEVQLLTTNVAGFDVKDNQLIYGNYIQQNADIYTTQQR
jgi:DNA-binding winged helix-turn-helix (wHTH) protein/Tol biopolymer transport system component